MQKISVGSDGRDPARTDAIDARIEVDTLGRKSYEAPKIAVGPVGTEGDPCVGDLL